MHMMIDIETLGVGESAPLFQIGACAFEPKGEVCDAIGIDVNLLDVILKTGFLPQKETVAWWQTQRFPFLGNEKSLTKSLAMLNEFFIQYKPEFVWANSPSFDLVILRRHYEAIGMTPLWLYWQELDQRTAKWIYSSVNGNAPSRGNVSHDAKDDAVDQVNYLNKLLP